jgi:hypothetical protein
MRLLAALAFLVVGACAPGPAASSQTTPSAGSSASNTQHASATVSPSAGAAGGGSLQNPSPNPLPSGLAVLVDLFPGGNAYDVALVAADGRVAATTHAHKRSLIAEALELPYVSASNSRVYYIDGDRDIRYLKADGTTGLVTSVPGSGSVHAAFAVTPDDARIAVGLLDYSVNPVQLTVYIEDIGGAHHSVIFTSTNHYVWPVAWHSGHLVVAYLGPSGVPFTSTFTYTGRDKTNYPYGPNAYGGINFHVINPVTAQREVIISGGGASGLLTKAGTAVVQGDGVDWSGQPIFFSTNDYGSFSASGSLSPDGKLIAACCPQPGEKGQLVIWYQGGATKILNVTVTSIDWVGWFDSTHLITGFYQRSDGTPSIVDIDSGQVTTVNGHGIVAAMLPGGLDS